jgi:dihydrofolate reductase
MIRIAVMMDRARVIGSSTPEGNEARYALLPDGLGPVMQRLYTGANVAGGESSWNMPTSAARNHRYVITRNPDFDVEGQLVEVITDAHELVERYRDSQDELVIVGGLAMFGYFLPHAHRLDISESHHLVPGDLVFDAWEPEGLTLTAREEHDGFDVLTYQRPAPEA